MAETLYTYKDWIVEYEQYPVDGAQVRVREWDGEEWNTRYNKRVIAESRYEALTTGLVGAGFDWEDANYVVESWDVYLPADEED